MNKDWNRPIALLWLGLIIAQSLSANTDYEPWWGDKQRESEWILGQGDLTKGQVAPCLIIPTEAIKTRQKQLHFRLTYLGNKADIDKHDLNFIERARNAIESTLAINHKPYYTIVLTLIVEKEKRLYGPLLQLTDFSKQLLDNGKIQQFYSQCGTHYIQSALVESSMRLWISYHPKIAEQAEKLQRLLFTHFPAERVHDVTRLSWFERLEQANIDAIPTRLYMEGWGNGPITPPFPNNANGQPVDHTLVEGWINQSLLRIYQPQGGQIKQVRRLPWLSSYPAVTTYCLHHPLKCDLKTFYLLNEARESQTRWRKRYRLLALMQTHDGAGLRSLQDCFRFFSLLDTPKQSAHWLQCQKDSYQKNGLSSSCQTLGETIDFCEQNPVCYTCSKWLELSRLCGESCQRYPDLLAFEPTQREIGLEQPILLGQSWNVDNTVCLTTVKKRDLPEETIQTLLLYYPIEQSSETMRYQIKLDYRQRVGLDPKQWTLKPDIGALKKGRTFFRTCGSHYASEIRFSQQFSFQIHYNMSQPKYYQLEYQQLKTECDAPQPQLTQAADVTQLSLSLSKPSVFSCPIEVIFRPWRLDLYNNLANPVRPIEDCPPKLSPQACWETITTKGLQD